MLKLRRIIFLLCLLFSISITASADIINLTSSADTFINSRYPDNNDGANTWFDVGSDTGLGVRRGLLQFDLGAIPPGATVTSVVLRLTVSRVPPAGGGSPCDLYRLNAGWYEGVQGGQNGLIAAAGEATWNYRSNTIAAWTAPGALSDVAASPSASAVAPPTAGTTVSWNNSTMMADVQYWLTNAAGNFGWLVVSEAEAVPSSVLGFASRENTTLPKPTLEIGYTPAIGQNLPPTVAITNPVSGTAFTAPASVQIDAVASDQDGSVTNVQFFDGTTSLGVVTSVPYSVSVGFFPGTHTLTAVASDNLGATTTSSPVSITVGSLVITNPIAARVPKGNITVELQTIAEGMASPVALAVPDDGSGRMFIADQDGHVYILAGGNRLSTPLLDVSSRLVQLQAYDERGLLGLAIHPDFAQNPFLYTFTSEPANGTADFQSGITGNDCQTVIAEWRISASNSNAVDLASRREVMRIDKPQSNHNGGAMHFGPEGLLYIALGDGGQANDVGPGHVEGGNAQDLTRIWGKLIRIDVAGTNSANGQYGIPANNPFVGTNALPEIYAYGLRNPFSFSFDRVNGQIWLGDVGQNNVEEVDLINAGGNYGWNLREGAFWFDPSTGNDVTAPVRQPPPNLIDPLAQYDHDDGSAVIGGYVYHGSATSELTNHYVFGDWGSFSSPSGRLFYLDSNNAVTELRIGNEDRQLGLWVKGFGQGADGELYVMGSRWLGPSGKTGRLVKLVAAPTPTSITQFGIVNGTNVSASWSGGSGPFALQRKTSLSEPVWENGAITTASSATLAAFGSASCFRVAPASQVPRIPLTAWLTASAEHPTNSSTASGFGIFVLDGYTLTFNLSYSGLTGPALFAHIHGPATTSVNGPVLIDLAPYNGGGYGSNGTISGVILLTDSQRAMVLSGLTYVNFHTAANGGGEIRGQIAPVNMVVSLSGAGEVPPVTTPGSGLGNAMLVGNQLTFNISYRNLTGIATHSHIHGPATPATNAPVLVSLDSFNGGSYGASGSDSGSVTLTPTQLAYVIDGLTYVNFHTSLNGGGEIRGQLVPQSTAVPLTVFLSGLAERPTALTNSAFGNGAFSLEGNQLTFNIFYGGLSGSATAAHIHGAANSSANAGVMIDLSSFNGGSFGSSGTLSGSVLLTTPQRNLVLNGMTYVNFHTAANPGGEMRGQVSPVALSTDLNGVNERPSAITTAGTGSGTFALVKDQLSLCVTYANLPSPVTASHIHGPAGYLSPGSVLLDLSPWDGGGYGVSGALSGTAPLPVSTLLTVIDSLSYINFHTTNNPSGEIRGQLMR